MMGTVGALDRAQPNAVEPAAAPSGGIFSAAIDWIRFELSSLVGPSGWRSLIGPLFFVAGGTALLVYNHINERVTDVVFWLSLGLIVTVSARMLETNRKQRLELEELSHDAFSDRVTGLPNRRALAADIEAAVASSSATRVLVVLEVDDLQAYGDRFGFAAADELVRRIAQGLVAAVEPLGGAAYRFDSGRLAVLVPASRQQVGEIVLAASTSLRGDDANVPLGRAYGEVAIPDDAADPDAAFQVAGQRLAAHRQLQHHSARRQAHAVLVAALGARRPELRDQLRSVAYRAISLARRLGLSRAEIDDIALAAEIQEIGLLAVPESILERSDQLSEVEAELVQRHPLEGERMISAAPGLASVAALVRSSCERFDGGGYPDGLAGEAIPLGSRVIAVAVAYAGLTAQGPYRQAPDPGAALAELRLEAGSRFDPRVVEALASDLAEEAAPAPEAVPVAG
jgi:two-component system cell cycle response regulator